MFFRLSPKLALFALFFTAAYPAFSQAVPAAVSSGFPLQVGGGVSVWNTDWGHSQMEGVTLWSDYYLTHVPYILRGVGVDLEASDVTFNKGDKPNNFREATAGGGVIYSPHVFRDLRPYVKFDLEYGGIDFTLPPDSHFYSFYHHDSRTVTAPGLGVEYHLVGRVWARADWEYQFWPKLFGPHTLNPHGFTFGAMYDLRRRTRY
jgi:hypothetical protein